MNVLKVILISATFIILDLAVYVILGLLLMNYDDFYEESKGEYWSLSSMTMSEKATYIRLNVWHIVNLMAAAYIIFRIIKKYRADHHLQKEA